MRVIGMHRSDASCEAGAACDPELMGRMGQLVGEMQAQGIMESTEGLRPSSLGVRLNYINGQRTVTPGPLKPGLELPNGFAIVRVKSLEDAIQWSDRYADVVGDVEIDVRPVCEMWDMGFGTKPAGLETTRYMLMDKATPQSESCAQMSPETAARMAKLLDVMKNAGVLLASEGLQPSRTGKRISIKNGRTTITDGPFTEAKELIAGYAIMNVASMDEAVMWSERFGRVLKNVEMDIRPAWNDTNCAQKK